MGTVKEQEIGYTENPGSREVRDGIYCMKESIVSTALEGADESELPGWFDSGEELHSSQSAYVIVDDSTLVFDTWSPASRDEVVDELEAVLDGRELDYLVVSHMESNHAGNMEIVLREYLEATLVVPLLWDRRDHWTHVPGGTTGLEEQNLYREVPQLRMRSLGVARPIISAFRADDRGSNPLASTYTSHYLSGPGPTQGVNDGRHARLVRIDRPQTSNVSLETAPVELTPAEPLS